MDLLVCTDLDGTLIPNGEGEESPRARELFKKTLLACGARLAYVTGRDLQKTLDAMADYALPFPDLLITDVGSAIYAYGENGWRPLLQWQESILHQWQDDGAERIRELLGDVEGLCPQDESCQKQAKLSYTLALTREKGALFAEIYHLLQQENLGARLIYSLDIGANQALLDILPEKAGKSHAIEFCRKRFGYPVERVVFAGDSGNDLDVFNSRIPSVLVSNSHEVVRAEVRSGPGYRSGTVYLAAGGALGMNGNYAAGIVEGLLYYHPQIAELLLES